MDNPLDPCSTCSSQLQFKAQKNSNLIWKRQHEDTQSDVDSLTGNEASDAVE